MIGHAFYKMRKYEVKYKLTNDPNKKKVYDAKLRHYTLMSGGNQLDYVINLLWINKNKDTKIPDRVFEEMIHILSLLTTNGNKKIQFFIDTKYIQNEDMTKILEIVKQIDTQQHIKIIELRSIFLDLWTYGNLFPENQIQMFGTNLSDLFIDDLPIYARVDFAKILISMFNIEIFYKNPNNKDKIFYNIFVDMALTDDMSDNIDIKKLSYEYFFSEKSKQILNDNGLLMGKHHSGGAYSMGFWENRFFIMSSDLRTRTSLFLMAKSLARDIMKLYKNKSNIQIDIYESKTRNIGFMFYKNLQFLISHFRGKIVITHNKIPFSTDPNIFTKELYDLNKTGLLVDLPIDILSSGRISYDFPLIVEEELLSNNLSKINFHSVAPRALAIPTLYVGVLSKHASLSS